MKVLQESWLATDHSQSPAKKVCDYVTSFNERLRVVCDLTKSSLASVQDNMKSQYDNKSVQRCFKTGDKVLVLLPVPGSALHAKFSGPYVIATKRSDTDYVVKTPERKRKSRVCHINMLKPYISRSCNETSSSSSLVIPVACFLGCVTV